MSPILNAYAKLIAALHVAAGACLAWLAVRLLYSASHAVAAIPGAKVGALVVIPPIVIESALAAWFAILGIRLWRRTPGWITALRWTHAVVLGTAVLQLAGGWVAIRGAERSAAHGGGLLGGLGPLQVAAGLALAGFAVLSLPVALVAHARARRRGQPPS